MMFAIIIIIIPMIMTTSIVIISLLTVLISLSFSFIFYRVCGFAAKIVISFIQKSKRLKKYVINRRFLVGGSSLLSIYVYLTQALSAASCHPCYGHDFGLS